MNSDRNGYYPMGTQLWKGLKYFHPDSSIDNWGDPAKMDGRLVYGLEVLRKFVGCPIIVHCGYEERTTGGFHPLGQAVDMHIEGLHVVDQFIVASRFSYWRGVGLYPNWINPGLHLDTGVREGLDYGARWGCAESKQYVALDWEFLKGLT